MSGYSDILFLVGAMIMLSMLTLNTSRSYIATTDSVVRSDIEIRALARAQDIVDETRWLTNKNDFIAFYQNLETPQEIDINYDSYAGDSSNREEKFTIQAEMTSELVSVRLEKFFVTLTIENKDLNPPVKETIKFIKSYEQ